MKKHLSTHSYKDIQFQCSFCNFCTGEEIEMEVHIGKEHSDEIECGLCEINTKDKEELEMHLSTCEIYKCISCNKIFRTLPDLKHHFTNSHEKEEESWKYTEHIKQNRENSEIFHVKRHSYHDLFQKHL